MPYVTAVLANPTQNQIQVQAKPFVSPPALVMTFWYSVHNHFPNPSKSSASYLFNRQWSASIGRERKHLWRPRFEPILELPPRRSAPSILNKPATKAHHPRSYFPLFGHYKAFNCYRWQDLGNPK
ncbi:hypothetical protein PGT21_005913 [Puccinia graminis f. sp. tritici]|uniref:Uncharacterized protein n=1 Tax=Puccinia graminis f. sp. tritici TaxID=56615 RepID=A0A5B0QHI4_PUCGR|nr:hypothetical protein PGT21_005913 [Puccinia graminis f. sp. tritici]